MTYFPVAVLPHCSIITGRRWKYGELLVRNSIRTFSHEFSYWLDTIPSMGWQFNRKFVGVQNDAVFARTDLQKNQKL